MALPFFNRFPYTNIGDINLDWIIKQVKLLTKRVEDLDPEDITERLNQVEAEAAQASVDAASAASSATDAAASAASAVTAASAAQTTANSAQTAANTANTAISNLPSSATPLMDGAASAGTNSKLSRADHVHPHDTTCDVLYLNIGTITELPYTHTDSRITSDMYVSHIYLGNPKCMESTWIITTSNGSLTITGTIFSVGTSVRLYLSK